MRFRLFKQSTRNKQEQARSVIGIYAWAPASLLPAALILHVIILIFIALRLLPLSLPLGCLRLHPPLLPGFKRRNPFIIRFALLRFNRLLLLLLQQLGSLPLIIALLLALLLLAHPLLLPASGLPLKQLRL